MAEQRPRYRKSIYETLLERDGGQCHYCECYFEGSGRRGMTIDHVVALLAGGSNFLENFVLACYTCNQRKGELSYDEYADSEYLAQRRISLEGQIAKHRHESIRFTRSGNWSCLCGAVGVRSEDPKTVECTLIRYGAFYRP